MIKHIYEIDSDGFLLDIHPAEVDVQGVPIIDPGFDYITTDPPEGLYRHKWTGAEWVETKTQAEFEEEEFLQSLIPSSDEIEAAEFEIKILNILMEVEVI